MINNKSWAVWKVKTKDKTRKQKLVVRRWINKFEKMLNERIKAMEVSQQQALLELTRAELERARAEVQELRAHQGGDVNMVG